MLSRFRELVAQIYTYIEVNKHTLTYMTTHIQAENHMYINTQTHGAYTHSYMLSHKTYINI